jgi:hypothetical protein
MPVKQGNHELPLDLTQLGNGIYFYRLYVNGIPMTEAGTRRLIVAR